MIEQEARPRHRIRNFFLLVGISGIGFVWANALLWQSGPHPAPLFAGTDRSVVHANQGSEFLTISDRAVPARRISEDLDERYYRDLQTALKSLGYYSGEIDGIIGPISRSAVSAFETARGLPPTGKATYRLFLDIRESAQQASRILGSTPLADDQQTILSLQRVLADLGYGPGPVNGELTVSTEDAIRRFEADRGMPLTGKISDVVVRELTSVSGVQIDPQS